MVGYAPTALYCIESRGKHMNNLVVKSVDLFGDSVMAAKDKEGNIWAGVSWLSPPPPTAATAAEAGDITADRCRMFRLTRFCKGVLPN